MTNDQLNRLLAELLGWTNVQTQEFVFGKPTTFGKPPPGIYNVNIPDYCGDLNAVYSVVMGLSETQRIAYRTQLIETCVELMSRDTVFVKGSPIDATAAQRTLALIRTLEGES
jgi:hypothetical protein